MTGYIRVVLREIKKKENIKTMAYKKSPAQIGLERKLKSWDNRELGMQIGACLNKAVDIVIALGIKEEINIEARIRYWTNALFKIGTDKKIKETTPQPVDLDKAEKQGEEFKKNVLEKERIETDSKGDDIERANKEANPIRETEEKNETYTTPSKEQFGEAQDKINFQV